MLSGLQFSEKTLVPHQVEDLSYLQGDYSAAFRVFQDMVPGGGYV